MKAFFIPSVTLAVILLISLWTGSYVNQLTEQWLTDLDSTGKMIDNGLWSDAQSQLLTVHQDWEHHQSSFHLFLEHQDLDAAEELFSGAIAACREENSTETLVWIHQLSTQLTFLAETQSVSIENIL